MNYNIDLPEELKTVSIPKLKVTEKNLLIINNPSLWDLMIPLIVIVVFFVMILNGQISFKDSEYKDYLILVIVLMLLVLIQYCSLNKVSIDFERKLILIKNHNPLINLGRKFFKLPSLISFDEVNKIYSDWQFWKKSIYRYDVVLQTDASYKFRIAIFSSEIYSVLLSEYLNRKIKAE